MDARRLTATNGEEPPRTPRWLRAPMIGAAIIGVAAVITLVTIQLLPNVPPAGTASGSPQASATPAATSEPSPTAAPSTPVSYVYGTDDWPTAKVVENAVPGQLDLARTGFWTLESSTTDGDWTLRVGTLGGRITREVTLTPMVGPLILGPPEPVGPASGRVLYVSDDGRTASLHVVDATTGDDREIMNTDAFIPRLAIDPAGTSAFYLALDRRTGAFQGVFGIAIEGGQPMVIISHRDVQPVATNATLAAIPTVVAQLAVSDDGQWLVYSAGWCQPDGCDLYAARTTGDANVLHTPNFQFGDTILAVSGSLLIGTSDCGPPSCDGFVIDLQTGERWPLGGAAFFAASQVIDGPHGPVALGQSDATADGAWDVEALDLTDRTRTTAFTANDDGPPVKLAERHFSLAFLRDYSVVKLVEPLTGAELPPGWFLIYRNADAAPAPYRGYSAAPLGGTVETPLPIMTFPGG